MHTTTSIIVLFLNVSCTCIHLVDGDAQLPPKRRGRDGGGSSGCDSGVLLPQSTARQQPHTGLLYIIHTHIQYIHTSTEANTYA